VHACLDVGLHARAHFLGQHALDGGLYLIGREPLDTVVDAHVLDLVVVVFSVRLVLHGLGVDFLHVGLRGLGGFRAFSCLSHCRLLAQALV